MPENAAQTVAAAVKHIHKTEEINGLKQEINIMEINPKVPGIRVRPVLSHDIIYGFEMLSEMAGRKKAYAAINGGFFSRYGLPSGMVVIDGELISASTGKYPVFIVENGLAALKEFNSIVTIEFGRNGIWDGDTAGSGNGRGGSDAGSGADGGAGTAGYTGGITRISADCFNASAGAESVAVYTPVYGQTNRAKNPNVTVTVEGGIITKVAFYNDEAEIPQNGMLISFFNTDKYSVEALQLKAGDKAILKHQPEIGEGADAYECGSWLVRDGKAVVPLKDAWVGVLTNRDPRTAVGIKENGTVVLMTVDGRQPGYSAGFTGQELADYLIGYGVKEAAMLDGGASTEMLVERKLVSRPSYKGEERTLGGGILVLTEE